MARPYTLESWDALNDQVQDAQACIAELEQRNAELEKELATLKETAADANYIAAIPALCRGEEVPCALHVSQPINELRARIAELEKMVELLTSCWYTKDLHAEMYFYDVPSAVHDKAIALLQPEAGKEVVT